MISIKTEAKLNDAILDLSNLSIGMSDFRRKIAGILTDVKFENEKTEEDLYDRYYWEVRTIEDDVKALLKDLQETQERYFNERLDSVKET